MSQARFAAEIGVHRSAVAQWERLNGCRPSLDRLLLIACVSGVSVDWLVGGAVDAAPRAPAPPVAGAAVRDALEQRLLDAMRGMHAAARLRLVEYVEASAAPARTPGRRHRGTAATSGG